MNISAFRRLFEFLPPGLKTFVILVRHFFNRMFRNDVVDFEDQMKERLIGILVLFAVMCGHVSNVILFKYWLIKDEGLSWVEKCNFLSLTMVLMAFVSVVVWEVIFIDRRDAVNLIQLPLRKSTLFGAKFTSLFLFIGIFAVGMNAVAWAVFFYYLPKDITNSLAGALKFVLVHWLCSFFAVFFIFFLIALIMGVLMAVLGERLYHHVALYLRSVLLIGCMVFLGMVLLGARQSGFSFSSFMEFRAEGAVFLNWFPPMWFTGLYEFLLGNPDPYFRPLAHKAVLGMLIVIPAFFLVSAVGMRHHLRSLSQGMEASRRIPKWRESISSLFNRMILPDPFQRAVYHFFGSTLRRSLFHKMRLVVFFAVGAGLILIYLFAHSYFWEEGINLITDANIGPIQTMMILIPLILSFFLILGLKSSINLPIALEANWIFRLTDAEKIHPYRSALRKGIVLLILVPLFAVLGLFYAMIWGLPAAWLHIGYGFSLSILTMEILFYRYRKIPFACAFLPGKEKIQLYWVIYVLLFLVYIMFSRWLGILLLIHPNRFLTFIIVSMMIWIILRVTQNYRLRDADILYDEQPEQVLITMREAE